MTLRLGFLASGGGTNLQSILDACSAGVIKAEPAVVIGNNSKARSLERARAGGVATAHLSSVTHPDPDALDRAILNTFLAHDVELVILAGYNKKLGPATLGTYRNRVLNIHPAPLPRFGGQGLYGESAHRAVLESGVGESAATVHIVDGEYDHGPVVAHIAVPVMAGDTPASLAERVLAQEHILYVDTIRRIAAGELALPDPGDAAT